ncbi:MAG: hypothetical protein KGS61_19925, partial [Verrucomicrobia bacterium]|nr:hypothetical protein [Verrucomicrobiota bacterium]
MLSLALWAAVAFCESKAGSFRCSAQAADPLEPVGFSNPEHVVLPVNQVLTPAGRQVELPGLRPQVLAL